MAELPVHTLTAELATLENTARFGQLLFRSGDALPHVYGDSLDTYKVGRLEAAGPVEEIEYIWTLNHHNRGQRVLYLEPVQVLYFFCQGGHKVHGDAHGAAAAGNRQRAVPPAIAQAVLDQGVVQADGHALHRARLIGNGVGRVLVDQGEVVLLQQGIPPELRNGALPGDLHAQVVGAFCVRRGVFGTPAYQHRIARNAGEGDSRTDALADFAAEIPRSRALDVYGRNEVRPDGPVKAVKSFAEAHIAGRKHRFQGGSPRAVLQRCSITQGSVREESRPQPDAVLR